MRSHFLGAIVLLILSQTIAPSIAQNSKPSQSAKINKVDLYKQKWQYLLKPDYEQENEKAKLDPLRAKLKSAGTLDSNDFDTLKNFYALRGQPELNLQARVVQLILNSSNPADALKYHQEYNEVTVEWPQVISLFLDSARKNIKNKQDDEAISDISNCLKLAIRRYDSETVTEWDFGEGYIFLTREAHTQIKELLNSAKPVLNKYISIKQELIEKFKNSKKSNLFKRN